MQHSKYLQRSCIYHIRQMRCIKGLTNKKASVALINALVMSRVDYCNRVVVGLITVSFRDVTMIL